MKPFIHLFETPRNYYYFDVNRNENVRIEHVGRRVLAGQKRIGRHMETIKVSMLTQEQCLKE